MALLMCLVMRTWFLTSAAPAILQQSLGSRSLASDNAAVAGLWRHAGGSYPAIWRRLNLCMPHAMALVIVIAGGQNEVRSATFRLPRVAEGHGLELILNGNGAAQHCCCWCRGAKDLTPQVRTVIKAAALALFSDALLSIYPWLTNESW